MTRTATHTDTAQPRRALRVRNSETAGVPLPPDHPVMVMLNHKRSAGLWELAVIHALHTATHAELMELAAHYAEYVTVGEGHLSSVNRLMKSLGLTPVSTHDLDPEELRLDLIEAITAARQSRVESVRDRLESTPVSPTAQRFLDRLIESAVLIAAIVIAILTPGSRPRRKWQHIPDNQYLLYVLTCAVLTAAPPAFDTTGVECSPCV